MATIVLIPGLMCDAEAWGPQLASLSRLAPVHIACNDGLDSLGVMAEHILAATAGPLRVAGHSMGGRVALELAARAPERLESLALLSTGAHGTTEAEPASRGALVELGRREGIAAVAAAWLPAMLGPGVSPALRDAITAMLCRSTPETFAAQQKALLDRPDRTALLSAIACPTLVLTGEQDAWAGPVQHRAMADAIPHATLAIVANAGHMVAQEAPAEVAARLCAHFGDA